MDKKMIAVIAGTAGVSLFVGGAFGALLAGHGRGQREFAERGRMESKFEHLGKRGGEREGRGRSQTENVQSGNDMRGGEGLTVPTEAEGVAPTSNQVQVPAPNTSAQ